jgi:MFS transporter, UMF1 family
VVLFLIAYWLYIDGVNTVMKVAIDFGYKLGIGQRDLLVALLVVQFISFPAALVFGWLGGRIGPKWGLLIGLSVYAVVTLWAAFMASKWEFYVLACAVGLVQGGVFSLSRSYYARLIPSDESAEFFGFYDMIGKFAAVLGPLLVAAAAALTGSTRAAVPAVLPLLIGGGLLLLLAPATHGPGDRAGDSKLLRGD